MPTADEFTHLATRFDHEAGRLLDASRHLAAAPPAAGLDGWAVTTAVDVRTRVIISLTRSAAQQCSALAAQCTHRAAVCRGYTEAYDRYLRELWAYELRLRNAEDGAWVGGRPHPPARPASWVDRG